MPTLSPCEQQVLQLLAQGLEYKQIGQHLHRSPITVKQLLGRAYRKLGAHNGPHAVALALGAGLIDAPSLNMLAA